MPAPAGHSRLRFGLSVTRKPRAQTPKHLGRIPPETKSTSSATASSGRLLSARQPIGRSKIMHRSIVTVAAVLAAMLVSLPAGAGAPRPTPAEARIINVSASGAGTAHQHLTLALDKAAIVQLDTDARDVLVSNPGVVDAVVRTSRRAYLLGMKVGQTNAFFFDAAGRQVLALDITVERDVAGITSLMHANFPGSDIKITALNDNLVLTGTVGSAQEATRAQDLAARFATEKGTADPTRVVNMLKVKGREQVLIKVRVS